MEIGKANVHRDKGWQTFTDAAIAALSSKHKSKIVFILWGGFAHKKAKLIDASRHLVLKGVHPSPLSAHRGFFGCKHFSKTNEFLVKNGLEPIDWTLPSKAELECEEASTSPSNPKKRKRQE